MRTAKLFAAAFAAALAFAAVCAGSASAAPRIGYADVVVAENASERRVTACAHVYYFDDDSFSPEGKAVMLALYDGLGRLTGVRELTHNTWNYPEASGSASYETQFYTDKAFSDYSVFLIDKAASAPACAAEDGKCPSPVALPDEPAGALELIESDGEFDPNIGPTFEQKHDGELMVRWLEEDMPDGVDYQAYFTGAENAAAPFSSWTWHNGVSGRNDVRYVNVLEMLLEADAEAGAYRVALAAVPDGDAARQRQRIFDETVTLAYSGETVAFTAEYANAGEDRNYVFGGLEPGEKYIIHEYITVPAAPEAGTDEWIWSVYLPYEADGNGKIAFCGAGAAMERVSLMKCSVSRGGDGFTITLTPDMETPKQLTEIAAKPMPALLNVRLDSYGGDALYAVADGMEENDLSLSPENARLEFVCRRSGDAEWQLHMSFKGLSDINGGEGETLWGSEILRMILASTDGTEQGGWQMTSGTYEIGLSVAADAYAPYYKSTVCSAGELSLSIAGQAPAGAYASAGTDESGTAVYTVAGLMPGEWYFVRLVYESGAGQMAVVQADPFGRAWFYPHTLSENVSGIRLCGFALTGSGGEFSLAAAPFAEIDIK